jgi:hypothetical protein
VARSKTKQKQNKKLVKEKSKAGTGWQQLGRRQANTQSPRISPATLRQRSAEKHGGSALR